MSDERTRRPRDWRQPKSAGECCTAENLGDIESLPGTIRGFRRCGVCNRRHFVSDRERAAAALRESGDEAGARALESAVDE